ncbi:hypothetical protein DY000_02013033 [Brassica cretica]|uniref:Ubiquitin-like protease family profile domain-containing protein n=1 Tax=Brassica cretica TaxID=69181 RepID=A0ABQ7CVH4_BRACR|nr:hypothetical protein DY000_02013033 [Brassica cretica]
MNFKSQLQIRKSVGTNPGLVPKPLPKSQRRDLLGKVLGLRNDVICFLCVLGRIISESVNGAKAGHNDPHEPSSSKDLSLVIANEPEEKPPDQNGEPSLLVLDKEVPTDSDLQKGGTRRQIKRNAAMVHVRGKSERARKLDASQQTPFKGNITAKVIIPNKRVAQGYDPFAPFDKKMSKVLTDWVKLDPNEHWIAIWISIPKRHIVVWDSILTHIRAADLDVLMEPFVNMSESVNGAKAEQNNPQEPSSLKDLSLVIANEPEEKPPEQSGEPSLLVLDKEVPTDSDLQKGETRRHINRNDAMVHVRGKSERARKLAASQQTPFKGNNTAKVIIPNKRLAKAMHMDAFIIVLRQRYQDNPHHFRSERLCFLDHVFSRNWSHHYSEFKSDESDINGLGRRLLGGAWNYRAGILPSFCQSKKHIVVWDILTHIRAADLDVLMEPFVNMVSYLLVECAGSNEESVKHTLEPYTYEISPLPREVCRSRAQRLSRGGFVISALSPPLSHQDFWQPCDVSSFNPII